MTGLMLVLPGMLLGVGAWLVMLAFRPQYLRLDDALASLADHGPRPDAAPDAGDGERLGAWLLRRRPVVVTATLERRLELAGRSLARHHSLKALGAAAGFSLPLLAGLAAWVVTGASPALPALVAVAGGAVGFILPDVLLRTAAGQVTEDATESLLTYFDLVTLERLANQSATQSLHAAASVSDTTIFATVRAALDRARLEQRMPYTELRDVGRRLELAALVDLADVMRLDDTGAALSGTLRARVKELRDAHLTASKIAASAVSERMTIFMVVPSLVFGLFFLTPPLLKLVFG